MSDFCMKAYTTPCHANKRECEPFYVDLNAFSLFFAAGGVPAFLLVLQPCENLLSYRASPNSQGTVFLCSSEDDEAGLSDSLCMVSMRI